MSSPGLKQPEREAHHLTHQDRTHEFVELYLYTLYLLVA